MIQKVKNFDKKLEQYENYHILMTKVVRYLMEICCIPVFIIPIQEFDRDLKLMFVSMYFPSVIAIAMFLDAYINITQGNREIISIYKILKYTPVDMKIVFRVRLSYLYYYCRKKLLFYLLFQIGITGLTMKTISIWNILFPILWVFIASFLPGFLMIYFKSGNLLKLLLLESQKFLKNS